MKKKTVIIYIIILVIVSSIVGIASYNIGTNNKNNNSNSSKKKETKIISREELSQYMTEIPITADNWKDYCTVENKEVEYKNDSGEITSTGSKSILKLKDNIIGYMELKLKINSDALPNDSKETEIITVHGDTRFRQ